MRPILFLTSMLLAATNAMAMPGNYDGDEPNLRALWHFTQDAEGSATFSDATGKHTLSPYGSAALTTVEGLNGMDQAVSGFSGQGALESTTLGDSATYTFETWLKWDDVTSLPQNCATTQVVMANLVKDSFSAMLFFSDGNVVLEIRASDESNQKRSLSFAVPDAVAGCWYHLAYSLTPADTDQDGIKDDVQATLYWNDENTVTTQVQPVATGNFTDFTYRADGWRFRLGKRYSESNDQFRGCLDEVRLVDEVLTTFATFHNGNLAFYHGKKAFFLGQDIHAQNLPDLSQYGLAAVPRFSSQTAFWNAADDPATTFPQEDKVRAAAQQVADEVPLYYLDVENQATGFQDSEETNISSIQKLSAIADWVHSEKPGIRLGYYSLLPERTYYEIHNERWQERNSFYVYLAQHVDVVFPSLYTFYPDQEGWVEYAKENLKEARIYGKPVYAFLWPVYHESSANAGQLIPGDYWRLQLETAYKYADGIVIWSTFAHTDWATVADASDPDNWWYQTLQFIKEKQLNPEESAAKISDE